MSLPGNLGSPPPDDRLVESVVRAAAVGLEGCPDAEVLGLYAERALDDNAERAAMDAHVSACAHCQAIVADHVRALPVEVETPSGAVPAVAGWLSGWRWLVPLASAAAVGVVAVWIGRNPADGLPEPAQVGQNRLEAQVPQVGPPASARVVPPADAAAPSSTDLARRDQASVPDRKAAVRAEAPAKAVDALAEARGNRERQLSKAEVDMPAAPVRSPDSLADASKPAEGLARQRAAAPRGTLEEATRPEPERTPAPAALGVAAPEFRSAAPSSWRVREGRVERSVDDGITWVLVELPTTETVTSVAVRKDGTVVATSSSGRVWTSDDDGASWTRTPPR